MTARLSRRGLVADYARDLTLVPSLPKRLERRSPSILELVLREGVRSRGGDARTAEDVAFAFGPERYPVESMDFGPRNLGIGA